MFQNNFKKSLNMSNLVEDSRASKTSSKNATPVSSNKSLLTRHNTKQRRDQISSLNTSIEKVNMSENSFKGKMMSQTGTKNLNETHRRQNSGNSQNESKICINEGDISLNSSYIEELTNNLSDLKPVSSNEMKY